MPAFIDITGHRYNRLVVIRKLGRDKRGYFRWLCHCDCGNKLIVTANSLRQNNATSCGCKAQEVRAKNGRANRTHGESHLASREYRAWHGMRDRCNNPHNKDFMKYGGRGIKICRRWSIYENFLADMGRCPPGYSIDRINNDGRYAPENCRWATSSEQNRNRRKFIRYTRAD